MSLIILPTAKLHCSCGHRLAPHPLAAQRMRLPGFERQTRICACGQRVIHESSRGSTGAARAVDGGSACSGIDRPGQGHQSAQSEITPACTAKGKKKAFESEWT